MTERKREIKKIQHVATMAELLAKAPPKSDIEKAMDAIEKSHEGSHLMGNINVRRRSQKAITVGLVREFCKTHLGCSAKDAARALNISYDCAVRAISDLRAEWPKK